MLDCVQCSSIVFNIHYVQNTVFSFSLSLCTLCTYFSQHFTGNVRGTGRGDKRVEEEEWPAEECVHLF